MQGRTALVAFVVLLSLVHDGASQIYCPSPGQLPNIIPVPKSLQVPQPSCTGVSVGMNFNNTDWADGNGPRSAVDAADCCAQCTATDGCNYWSFQVDPTVPGKICHWATLTYCCWMHSDNSNPVKNPQYTSGAVVNKQENLNIPQTARILAATASLMPLASLLSDEVYLHAGVRLTAAQGTAPNPGDILLQLSTGMPSEAYQLQVSNVSATVTGGDYTGVAWGTVTLLQSLCVQGVSSVTLSMPYMTVKDVPDVPYRGMLVDVARSLVEVDDIREAIVYCRFYKIRYLHLHLTDDHAWTFPSTAYPTLGSLNVGFRGRTPYVYKTQELTDLVNFAAVRGVVIIPELEGPSHSGAMRRSCPTPFQGYGNNDPSGGGVLNLCSNDFYAAMKTILAEISAVFTTSPFIHVGCDELDTSELTQIPGYQQFITAHNVSGPDDLFAYYVKTMSDYVTSLGKQAMVWQGANIARLNPSDAIIMIWNPGPADPQNDVNKGFRIINAINDMQPASLEYTKSLYDFGDPLHPLPQTPLVLGSQANMWETGWGIGQLWPWTLQQEAARTAGQSWWAISTPRPSNDTFFANWFVTEQGRARLRFPTCTVN